MKKWIVSSTFWEQNKTRKRWEQVNWVLGNISKYEQKWFYFDLHFNKYVYMEREKSNWTIDFNYILEQIMNNMTSR